MPIFLLLLLFNWSRLIWDLESNAIIFRASNYVNLITLLNM